MTQKNDAVHTHKVQVKFFAKDGSRVELEPFMGIFQKWIRENTLGTDELLIDAADYAHVKDGPGMLLVGHGVDYYFDEHEGRQGLLFCRKREFEGSFEAALKDALEKAAKACALLEKEPELAGKLSFDTSEVQVRVADRLNAPNTDETAHVLKTPISSAFSAVFGAAPDAIDRVSEEGELLSLSVKLKSVPLSQLAAG